MSSSKEEGLEPVIDDLSIFLIAGRNPHPELALTEAVEAERLGLRRGFLSERWDTQEAGAVLGGVAASTTRFEVGTGVLAVGTRHPLMTAALGATMQAAYGGRFILGLGRSDKHFLADYPGIEEYSYEAFAGYVDVLRQLWRGETVSYNGPAGNYDGLRMIDLPDCDPPPIWSGIVGGPKACRAMAGICDGIILLDLLTPEATQQAVTRIREERERLGLDPSSIHIAQGVITAPELDDEHTKNQAHCRFITYVVGLPTYARGIASLNGWDYETMEKIGRHPLFANMATSGADGSFYRHQLLEVAELVPDSWMRASCALGSLEECVTTLQAFRDAGADEIFIYGSTPADNARLVRAWRDHSKARQLAVTSP